MLDTKAQDLVMLLSSDPADGKFLSESGTGFLETEDFVEDCSMLPIV